MSAISKQDLNEAIGELKVYINEKFAAHEQVEKAMLAPVVEDVAGHALTLYGREGRGGIVQDMTIIKTTGRNAKFMAGGGFIAGLSSWVGKLFS